MADMSQHRIPALYMRGGTSKGVFFRRADLPPDPVLRDRLLLRVIGSPDPYGKQTDGLGGATSSTSKVVMLSRSERSDSDVDYCFGQVAIEQPLIDWSGNCGNLSAAVGPAAIWLGLVGPPPDGLARVRIWQANIGKRIHALVPVTAGEPVEEGDFVLDGVAFASAEIGLEFLDPAAGERNGDRSPLFPTGRTTQTLEVPDVGAIEVSLVDAGLPTVFVDAASLGLTGTELQPAVNADAELLARVEAIRAHAAVVMGLATTARQATLERPHVPKLCSVAPPADYVASDGRPVPATSIDLLARVFSMGRLHHAMTGTGAVALAVAAAVPGTLVQRAARAANSRNLCFGHPSGRLQVGAEVSGQGGCWTVAKVAMSRSARRLMEGQVLVPRTLFDSTDNAGSRR